MPLKELDEVFEGTRSALIFCISPMRDDCIPATKYSKESVPVKLSNGNMAKERMIPFLLLPNC